MKEMSTRAARVAKEMQRQISAILRDDLNDPRIGFTTITSVNVTGDLRFVRVYFTTLGGTTQENNSIAALKQANGFIRRLIGQRMDLRLVPEIAFKIDREAGSAFKIDEILGSIKREKQEETGENKK